MNILNKYKQIFCKFDHIGNYEANELCHLKEGDVVKVSHMNETFWVALTKNKNNGRKLQGKVDDNLFLAHGFDFGDVVKFNASNVLRYESVI